MSLDKRCPLGWSLNVRFNHSHDFHQKFHKTKTKT
jgi:hypothetical protein